ncbi:MAG: polysaccharide deacetylase family protein, partial [Nitrospinae bacterium]|nr:polysaccharide deacetylase family protein [Nitrospinota bacterium]
LAYHRVSDDRDESVSASIENFSKQISFLIKHFSIIPLARLIESIENKEPLPLNPVVITFDDGYKDVFINAYPVLKKYNLPATVFITTDYIEEKDLPYNPPLPYGERVGACPRSIYRGVRGMSWDDIQEMANNNILIGSHTISHPALSNLSDDEIERELRESKEIIEKHTGKEARLFSYPYGGRGFFDERVKEILKECGYRCGCSTIYGINDFKSDLFELKRIPINYYENETIFLIKLFGLLNPIARFMDRLL